MTPVSYRAYASDPTKVVMTMAGLDRPRSMEFAIRLAAQRGKTGESK